MWFPFCDLDVFFLPCYFVSFFTVSCAFWLAASPLCRLSCTVKNAFSLPNLNKSSITVRSLFSFCIGLISLRFELWQIKLEKMFHSVWEECINCVVRDSTSIYNNCKKYMLEHNTAKHISVFISWLCNYLKKSISIDHQEKLFVSDL